MPIKILLILKEQVKDVPASSLRKGEDSSGVNGISLPRKEGAQSKIVFRMRVLLGGKCLSLRAPLCLGVWRNYGSVAAQVPSPKKVWLSFLPPDSICHLINCLHYHFSS